MRKKIISLMLLGLTTFSALPQAFSSVLSPKWETVSTNINDDFTERLAVPGGWLVARLSGIHVPRGVAMVFVSDPEHKWVLTP